MSLCSELASLFFDQELHLYKKYIIANQPKEMSFFGHRLGPTSIQTFFTAFKWPANLQTLSFDQCQLGDNGLETLCDFLVNVPKTLEMLVLSNNKLSNRCLRRLAVTISQTNIKILNLKGNHVDLTTISALLNSQPNPFINQRLLITDQGKQKISCLITSQTRLNLGP